MRRVQQSRGEVLRRVRWKERASKLKVCREHRSFAVLQKEQKKVKTKVRWMESINQEEFGSVWKNQSENSRNKCWRSTQWRSAREEHAKEEVSCRSGGW